MNLIKNIRLAHKLNQQDFAALFHISQSAIAHYETGRRMPAPAIAMRIYNWCIARGADIDFADFYRPDLLDGSRADVQHDTKMPRDDLASNNIPERT